MKPHDTPAAHARQFRRMATVEELFPPTEPPTPAAPQAPPAQIPQPSVAAGEPPRPPTFRVHTFYRGYPVEVEVVGDGEYLDRVINRLEAKGFEPGGKREWAYTPDGLPICPKHGVPMKKREKQGDTWYSHVCTDNHGEEHYCRGYRGKDSPGYDV